MPQNMEHRPPRELPPRMHPQDRIYISTRNRYPSASSSILLTSTIVDYATAMPVNLNPPFRGEHCGSLKRPLWLLEKRQAFNEGKISLEELTVAENEAIKAAVKMQTDVGIKAITDGELRRCVYVLLSIQSG